MHTASRLPTVWWATLYEPPYLHSWTWGVRERGHRKHSWGSGVREVTGCIAGCWGVRERSWDAQHETLPRYLKSVNSEDIHQSSHVCAHVHAYVCATGAHMYTHHTRSHTAHTCAPTPHTPHTRIHSTHMHTSHTCTHSTQCKRQEQTMGSGCWVYYCMLFYVAYIISCVHPEGRTDAVGAHLRVLE